MVLYVCMNVLMSVLYIYVCRHLCCSKESKVRWRRYLLLNAILPSKIKFGEGDICSVEEIFRFGEGDIFSCPLVDLPWPTYDIGMLLGWPWDDLGWLWDDIVITWDDSVMTLGWLWDDPGVTCDDLDITFWWLGIALWLPWHDLWWLRDDLGMTRDDLGMTFGWHRDDLEITLVPRNDLGMLIWRLWNDLGITYLTWPK